MMNGIGFGALMLVVWILLWGALTPANLLSGIVVVVLVMLISAGRGIQITRPTVRLWAVVRLVGSVIFELIRANAVVTREILSRGSSINTGVVGVSLPMCSDGMLTLVASVLCLTPGTLPVEVSRDPRIIYIHVLHLQDVETVRHNVRRLSELAVRAFGSSEAMAALSAQAVQDDIDHRDSMWAPAHDEEAGR